MAIHGKLAEVIVRAYEKKYANLEGRSLLQISDNHKDPRATHWKRPIINSQGSAKVWADRSQDPPRVNTQIAGWADGNYYTMANSYFFTADELADAQRNDRPLDTTLADAARRAHEEMLDSIILTGGGIFSFGLLNHPDALTSAVASGNSWLTMTAAELLAELHKMEDDVLDNSSEVLAPDTLVVPRNIYRALRQPISSTTPMTSVLSVFLQQAESIREVRPLRSLAGAAYVCAYNKGDQEMASLALPADFDQKEIEHPRGMLVECTLTTGGVISAHPKSIYRRTHTTA